MNRMTKIKITELNPHVICVLCGGYYVDATTIIECLHSFCRTCIIKYLETSKYCPICDVMVHKTRPLDNVRSDKTLQDLVYKLVPGLYKCEMKRRREYYSQHPVPGTVTPSEDHGIEFHDRIIYTEDEKISLTMELCAQGIPFKTPAPIHGHSGPSNIKVSDVRYLFCPAAFTVGNLKKFIRMKFDLSLQYEIDVFQTAEPLQDYYTLMDIAYIYTWTRRAPLRLYYTVYERKRNRPQVDVPDVVKQSQDGGQEAKLEQTNETNAPKLKNGVANGKRKLDDDMDDIALPQLNVNEVTVTNGKMDGGTSRKRVKKIVDSSVLEAMSKSEEQLAKLSLNSENSGDLAVDSVVLSDNSKKIDGENVEDNETGEKCSEEKMQLDSGAVSISLFQPLNVENITDNGTEKALNKTVSNALKPKGMPGRKKGVKDPKLVLSKQHPGLQNKKPTPTKTVKRKVKDANIPSGKQNDKDTPTKVTVQKGGTRGRKPNPNKPAKTKNQTVKVSSTDENGVKGAQSRAVKKKPDQNIISDVNEKVVTENGYEKDQTDESQKDNASVSPEKEQPAVSDSVPVLHVTQEANTPQNREPALPEASSETPLFNLPKDLPTPLYGKTPRICSNLVIPLPPVKVNDSNVKDALGGTDFRQPVNGFPISDQPLDLSPGSKEEYTKGKIFKTKMLKKQCPKPDLLLEQRERLLKQNGHLQTN